MKFIRQLLLLLTPALFSCSSDEPLPDSEITRIPDMIAMADISAESGFDLMLMEPEGSYMFVDFDYSDGLDMVYFNSSKDNDFNHGIALYLTENGTPVKAVCGNVGILYNLNSDEGFDCAIIRPDGSVEYMWDFFRYDSSSDSRAGNTLSESWHQIRDFDYSWDGHMAKVILPVMAKLAAFTIQSCSTVLQKDALGLLLMCLSETNKSGYTDINLLPLKTIDDISTFKEFHDTWGDPYKRLFTGSKIGLSQVASTLIEWADKELENMGRYEPVVDATFRNSEWQIKLGQNVIETGPEKNTFSIPVSTKAAWTVVADGPAGWCRFYKDGNRLIVEVDAYEGSDTRVARATVKTVVPDSDIPPASLTVIQSGADFDLDTDNLTFESEGGSKGILVKAGPAIKEWTITSRPDWCRIEKGRESFFVTVDKCDEIREGTITVTAFAGENIRIDRTVHVLQQSVSWDYTRWHFQGDITVSVNLNGLIVDSHTTPCTMTLFIYDTSKGEAVISDGKKSEKVDKVEITPEGDLRLSTDVSKWKDARGYCTILCKRTSAIRADAAISAHIATGGGGVTVTSDITGSMAGMLEQNLSGQ